MAPSTSMCAEGIVIGRKKDAYKIGKELGSGVCGAVHVLIGVQDGLESNDWCIKVAPLGNRKSNATKQKDMVHNANLLYYENLMYTNHLASIRGTIIPQLPLTAKGGGPSPHYGEVNGFRYLVMERMALPLFDGCLMELGKPKNNLASVAIALLDTICAIHSDRLLVIDVKPDNFMISGKKGRLADRVRMIDLGLLQNIGSMSGHRANEGISEVVGTPLYVSLNVHALDTPSRRDDVEALGYILCELILKMKEGAGAELPWAGEGSDDAIFKLKKRIVESRPSHGFWKHLPVAMKEYFDNVITLSYKEEPDYDKLRSILNGLEVDIAGTRKEPTTKKKAPPVSRPTKASQPSTTSRASRARARAARQNGIDPDGLPPRRKRLSQIDPDGKSPSPSSDVESPTKMARRDAEPITGSEPVDSSFETFVTAADCNSQEDTFKHYDDDDDDDDFEDPMDWEASVAVDKKTKPLKATGLTLLCVGGPHKGEEFSLVHGETFKVTIGSAEADISLLRDTGVDSVHAELKLQSSRRLKTVLVKDARSRGGTFINTRKIPTGKEQKAFINDVIKVGSSDWKVVPLKKTWKTSSVPTPVIEIDVSSDQDVQMGDENSPPTAAIASDTFAPSATAKSSKKKPAAAKRTGVRLEVKEGQLTKGDNIVLEKKGENSRLIGKIVKFELVVKKGFCSVQVTTKGMEKVAINGKALGKGKPLKAFIGDEITIGSNDKFKIVKL